jgi:3-deoxy-D-manno-octulosonic-acid transferase
MAALAVVNRPILSGTRNESNSSRAERLLQPEAVIQIDQNARILTAANGSIPVIVAESRRATASGSEADSGAAQVIVANESRS